MISSFTHRHRQRIVTSMQIVIEISTFALVRAGWTVASVATASH
jgi:hypothetical protein